MDKYDFALDMETDNSCSLILRRMNKNCRVLEFGPAHGRMTRYMKEELNCTVDIVEYDDKAGKAAARFAERALIGAENGDITKFHWRREFADTRYDFIVFADVLEHITLPYEALRYAAELLKDDGVILVSVPNVAHNSLIISAWNDKFPYSEVGLLDNTHIHLFAHNTFIGNLKNCRLYVDQAITADVAVNLTEFAAAYEDVPRAVARDVGRVGDAHRRERRQQFVLRVDARAHYFFPFFALMTGICAAATDWPRRRAFSSGMKMSIFSAHSG